MYLVIGMKEGILMVRPRDKKIIWVLYLLTGFSIFLYTLNEVQLDIFFSIDYALFAVLGVFVSLFPIRAIDAEFSIGDGVFLVVFVIYGLVPGLLVSFLAIFASLIRVGVEQDQHYRYPLNFLMLIILSILSAGAYYGTENLLDSLNVNTYGLLPMLVYVLVQLYFNHVLVFLITKYFYKQENTAIINEHFFFSLMANIYLLPLAYLLIYLYNEIGIFGILAAAIPIVIITLSVNTQYRTQTKNNYLMQASKATQKMTANMDHGSIIEAFISSLLEIFPAERINEYKVIGKNHVILKCIHHKDGTVEHINREIILQKNSILYKALESHKIETYDKANEWIPPFNFDTSYHPESAMVLPVHILTQDKALLLMTHSKRLLYEDFLLSLVELFYRNFLIALVNATHFERLEKSNLTDYLTNLPNYRGFSKAFDEVVRENSYERLTTIILDLDHFKRVNDIHGHEAGNDVLRQVADVLREFNNDDRYVARYGGEEFVVSLKDYEKDEVLSGEQDVAFLRTELSIKLNYK